MLSLHLMTRWWRLVFSQRMLSATLLAPAPFSLETPKTMEGLQQMTSAMAGWLPTRGQVSYRDTGCGKQRRAQRPVPQVEIAKAALGPDRCCDQPRKLRWGCGRRCQFADTLPLLGNTRFDQRGERGIMLTVAPTRRAGLQLRYVRSRRGRVCWSRQRGRSRIHHPSACHAAFHRHVQAHWQQEFWPLA